MTTRTRYIVWSRPTLINAQDSHGGCWKEQHFTSEQWDKALAYYIRLHDLKEQVYLTEVVQIDVTPRVIPWEAR